MSARNAAPKSRPRLKATPTVETTAEPRTPSDRLMEYAGFDSDHLYLSAIDAINRLASRLHDVLHAAGNEKLSHGDVTYHGWRAGVDASGSAS